MTGGRDIKLYRLMFTHKVTSCYTSDLDQKSSDCKACDFGRLMVIDFLKRTIGQACVHCKPV